MFREMHDDKIGAWGWPWHGLIDSDVGLHHPQQSIPFNRIYGGICTTLMDIGAPAVETPAEVTAMGGELWSRGILKWSFTTGQNGGGLPGFALPGFPICTTVGGQTRVVRWIYLQCNSVGGLLRFSGRIYSVDNFRTGSAFTWDFPLDECGQGAGQPSIELFSASSTVSQAVLGTGILQFDGTVLDVRDDRLLFGITARGLGNVASAFYPERPPMWLGLVELVVSVDGETDQLTPSVNVVLDRAGALGAVAVSQSGSAVNGNLLEWPVATVTDTRVDWPTCSGSEIIEAPGGMVESTIGGSGFLFDRVDNRTREYRITGGLLCARYGDDGSVQTATYDAEYSITRDLVRTHTNHGRIYIRTDLSLSEDGRSCVRTETSDTDSYVIFDEHERTQMLIRHAIYGYNGALVDEHNLEGSTNWSRLYKYHRRAELSEYLESEPYTRVAKINGTVVGTIELPYDTAPNTRTNFDDAPTMRGQGLLTSIVPARTLFGGMPQNDSHTASAIWPLSNHLACIVRHSSNSANSNTLTAGPALTPSGVDPGSYSYPGGWTGAQRDVFLSGAYNPVTGEVARCDPLRQFSWA